MEDFESVASLVRNVVLDSGQAHGEELRGKDVVEPAHAVVLRNPAPFGADGVEHAVGHHVVDRHEGRDAPLAEAFAGQLEADRVLDGNVVPFLFWGHLAGTHDYGAFGAFVAVGVAHAFQTADAGGIGLVQRGGDIGYVLVPEADHIVCDDGPGAVVVHLHGVHVEAGVAVPDDHDRYKPVHAFHQFGGLRHHGEHHARQIRTGHGVQDADFVFGVAVSRVDEGVAVFVGGGLLDGLYDGGIIRIEDVRADDEDCLAIKEGGPLFGGGGVTEGLGGFPHFADGIRGKGNVRPPAEDH